MNNTVLLTGLLCMALLSGVSRSSAQKVSTLEEIFEIAESNSVRLRPSFSAQEEAEKEISVARAARLPEISTGLSLSYIGDGFTTKRDFSDYQKAPIPHLGYSLSLSVNQPLYTGGAISNAIEMAKLKSSASRYATELQRDNIRFQITGFYLDIFKYSNLRRVVTGNIEAALKILDEMKSRYEQGVVLINDITRYELLLSNLELQLTRIDNTLTILNNNLVTIAGMPENTVIIPDSTILSNSLPLQDENWWRNEAKLNSPSLKLANSAIDINKKAESLVRSERLPHIGLNAGWTIDGPILVEVPPINRNLSYWYAGVYLSYNISSLYKSNRSLAKSKVATRIAEEQLDAAQEEINVSLRADYVRYMEAFEEMKTREKSVELAERNYRTVSTRYSEGMALVTDMLDAANSMLDAEQQLVNSRIDIIYYYYKLLFTSGKI